MNCFGEDQFQIDGPHFPSTACGEVKDCKKANKRRPLCQSFEASLTGNLMSRPGLWEGCVVPSHWVPSSGGQWKRDAQPPGGRRYPPPPVCHQTREVGQMARPLALGTGAPQWRMRMCHLPSFPGPVAHLGDGAAPPAFPPPSPPPPPPGREVHGSLPGPLKPEASGWLDK